MNSIIYKSIHRNQIRNLNIYHSINHIYPRTKLFQCVQQIGYQHHLQQHFCTENAKNDESTKSKKVRRLKSKVPSDARTIDMKEIPTASRFAMMAEEARKFEENYRWISPRNSIILILVYLAVSFSCFGYMWYHRLYASRLNYVIPFLLQINPERAHKIAIKVHAWPKFVRRILGMINNPAKDPTTKQKIWGLTFLNPIGMAAGFDKDAQCVDGILDMGFGFCEIGTVTPNLQKGNNDKQRVWRLKKDLAVINNYGNNSVGHDCVRARLLLRIENMDTSMGLVGVNLGKNNDTSDKDAINDYILGIQKFVDIADYLVFNIDLVENRDENDGKLEILLSKLMKARDELHEKAWQTSIHNDVTQTKPPAPPLLIKIAPDYNEEELKYIADAAMTAKIDGMIISNASSGRKNEYELKSKDKLLQHEGGLCGKPIFHKTNAILRKMYELTKGEIPLIGTGGIRSAREAYEKIKNGASLVQLYSAYTYNGPILIRRMIREIGQYAELDGFDKIEQAIGSEVRKKLGMDPLLKELSFEEEELMAPLDPLPQKSLAAKMYGVLDANYRKVTETRQPAVSN